VLAALQTFFNYSERASQHQLAARGYATLRRKIEQFLLENARKPRVERPQRLLPGSC